MNRLTIPVPGHTYPWMIIYPLDPLVCLAFYAVVDDGAVWMDPGTAMTLTFEQPHGLHVDEAGTDWRVFHKAWTIATQVTTGQADGIDIELEMDREHTFNAATDA